MNGKWFGILSGMVIAVVLILITSIFKINLIAHNSIGRIPIYLWLILLMGFLIFTYVRKGIDRKGINWAYLAVAVITFIYLNSMFQWWVDCCPEAYESMTDWNAAKGLACIVYVPFVFFIMIIQGAIFDALREKNRRKQITAKPELDLDNHRDAE